MPGSAPDFKTHTRDYLVARYPSHAAILDVGAGEGLYSQLLRRYFPYMDAVEIHQPYIDLYKLEEHYRYVFRADIREFAVPHYEIIILGDILEHMNRSAALDLLNRLIPSAGECIVSLPFLSVQGAAHDNEYETHLQADLTPELIATEYPMLKELWRNECIGVYTSRS